MLHPHFQHLTEPLRQLPNHGCKTENSSQPQHHRLHHVGPDYRLETARNRVESDKDSHRHNDPPEIDPGGQVDRNGDQEQHLPQPQQLQEDKAGGAVQPNSRPETLSQAFEGRGQLTASE